MILALRALGVGDLATAVPALRGLRGAFPGRPLALAAPAWLTPLIELTGAVDKIIPTGGLGEGLRTDEAPEVAVNLHGSGPESHRLLQTTQPAKLWAFASPNAGHLDGPPWIEEEHEVHRWCRLLRHYGVPADEADLSLAVPGVDVPAGVTIIHPGAKSPSRRWPAERFAAVASALADQGHRVVITGSESERALGERVAELAGRPAVLRTGLAELAGLVARARLLISGDTGIAHLASAYGTPSVVLFGPMSPSRWGPPARPYHRVLWHGTRSERGDSPDPGVHPALLEVTPAEVLDAAAAF
ncbi:glycosyltransferase family 9 protein [Actinoplanes sp. NPDC049596]|uniref:glycosyltransferase family 9 protein n=1 Tax=unclassified Actinoplanes TaxID=2626549 RepID=UPI003442616C